MLSKFGRRLAGNMKLSRTTMMGAALGARFGSQRLGIGDALSVLEEKISKISQLVHFYDSEQHPGVRKGHLDW